MRIAVIIPSYNEADNISFVTQMIDRGLLLALKKFPKISEAIIINVDSSSQDNTRKIFQKTKTNFLKLSLQTKGRPGKGKNLIYFLKKYYKKYDIFITLDADLKSIKVDWMIKLIAPFFCEGKDCDFVWPLYKRSRFEGSTTIHFAYPIIYSFFKLEVRQPIAGDFAFSQRLAAKIIFNQIPEAAFYYGIDILFSIRAAQYANHVQQINLGSKIHKPSFLKLEKMFPEVASSAVGSLKRIKNQAILAKMKINKSICISENKKFSHREEANALLLKKADYLSKNLKDVIWLKKEVKIKIKQILKGSKIINARLWSVILSSWINYALRNSKKDNFKLAKELLPFFILRTVSFWNSTSIMTAAEVEDIIKKQSKLIKQQLKL